MKDRLSREMSMASRLLAKLENDEVALGVAISFPAPGIVECLGKGWDWIWIDGQHGQLDYRTILACVRLADACDLASIVRVPSHEYGVIGRMADMKPTGIMAPMVDTPQQASRVVEALRFPPLGRRSYGSRRAIDLEGRRYYENANVATLLVAQIETPEAVENAQGIAATEGVDGLFFGADDMKVRLGISIDTPVQESNELVTLMKATIEAARNAAKFGGCVTPGADSLRLAASLGYRLLAGGGDVAFLRAAAGARLKELTLSAGQSL